MNKTLFAIILLLILLLPSQILMIKTENIYPSHDGLLHIERILEYDTAIKNGQIPPRLAPLLNAGIGYPMFISNYQMPYILAEPIMLISGNAVFAFKIVMSTTFILGALFAFLSFRNLASNTASLVGAVIFSYIPYRFANLYTRGAFGESVAIMFLMLVLFGLHQISKKTKYGLIEFAFGIFGLLTSHPIIFLLAAPFVILYISVMIKINRDFLKKSLQGFTIGILMSSFVLTPTIFERHYLMLDEVFFNDFYNHFVNFFQLFRIPKEGVNIGTSFQLGLTSIILLALSAFVFLQKRNLKLGFLLFAVVIYIFLTLKSSFWFWENLFILKYAVFPWRLLSVVVVIVALIAVFVQNQLKSKFSAIILIAITIVSSRHYFLNSTQYSSTEPVSIPHVPVEYATVWLSENTYEQKNLISAGKGTTIYNVQEKPFKISFDMTAKEKESIVVRKLFFPGWKLKTNGNKSDIQIKDGLISFEPNVGMSTVSLEFEESNVRKIGNFTSLITFAALIFFWIFKKLRLKLKNAKY